MITVKIKGKEELISDDMSNFSFSLVEDKQEVLVKYKDKEVGYLQDILGIKDEELNLLKLE